MGKYLNAPHMCATLKVIMQTNKLQQQLLNTLACIHIKLLHSHHNSHTNFAKILIFTLAFTYVYTLIYTYVHTCMCIWIFASVLMANETSNKKLQKKNQKCNIIQLFSLCKALLVGLFGCVGFVYKSLRTLFVKNNSYMLIRGKWLQRDIKSKNIYYLSTLCMCK